MLEQYFRSRRVLERLRTNALADCLDAYTSRLSERGHPISTIQSYVQCVEHFGVWLRSEGLVRGQVSDKVVGHFLEKHLPACQCPVPHPRRLTNVRAALQHLAFVLDRPAGGTPEVKHDNPVEGAITTYLEYLEEVCGLSLATRIYRERYAREFLCRQFGEGHCDYTRLRPEDLVAFVGDRARDLKPSSIGVLASSLRSFLRFIHLSDGVDERLERAVPSVFNPRLAGLPSLMNDVQLSAFLGAFDRRSPVGCRDYAMAVCFTDLALRASEVSMLRLDDIDWRQGIVRIRPGKTRQERPLPLTKRVGQAISRYLRDGRPQTLERRVFIRHSVPAGSALNTEQVRGAMRRAYARAGLPRTWTGTHILRRTAATRMHRQGASLKEVADVLGHRSMETTAIYAKVDKAALATVSLPWPEDAS